MLAFQTFVDSSWGKREREGVVRGGKKERQALFGKVKYSLPSSYRSSF